MLYVLGLVVLSQEKTTPFEEETLIIVVDLVSAV